IEIFTLSLHDALPISAIHARRRSAALHRGWATGGFSLRRLRGLAVRLLRPALPGNLSRSCGGASARTLRGHRKLAREADSALDRSEEHTSELQSRSDL